MKLKHLLLAALTVVIWGLNFIAIHSGLKVFPPFLLCAIRFGLAAIPWIFFIPRPKAMWKLIIGYGTFTFAVQFGLLFTGIYLGLSAGLSSLVIQVQVFFSIGLAAFFFKDRPSSWKILGALISFLGIGLVAFQVDGGTSLIGLVFTLFSALSWAVGNIFSKKIASESPLALVVWGSLVAFPIMIAVSVLVEGPALIYSSLHKISMETVVAIFYTVYLSTLVGYGIWGFLLNNFDTGVIVPFTLLIPVVGLLSSVFFLGEALPSWKVWACFFIILGLLFNLFEKQIRALVLKVNAPREKLRL